MYTPNHFKSEDKILVKKIIMDYPFANLITNTNGEINITKVTFELIDDQTLFGHIAAKNPQSDLIKDGCNVLCLFDGPHHYITPSVYEKREVPTWNYISLEIKGKLTVIKEYDEIKKMMSILVDRYEYDQQNAFNINQLNKDVTESYFKAITCFKINLDDFELKLKLSQNKSKVTQTNIINWLKTQKNDNASQISKWMESL